VNRTNAAVGRRVGGRVLATLISCAALGAALGTALVSSGCDNERTARVEERSEGGCDTFIVPQRFSFGWDRLNHRVSVMTMLPFSAGTEDACEPDVLGLAFVGGDFSTGEFATDDALADFSYQRVDNGPARAALLRIPMQTGPPPGETSGEVVYALTALDLPRRDHLVAFVYGFSITTDVAQPDGYPDDYEARLGYTTRGFGAGVSADWEGDHAVRVSYRGRLENGLAHDVMIRNNMNRAVEHAVSDVTLDVLLVAYDGPPPAGGQVGYTLSHDAPFAFTREQEPRPDPELQRVVVFGQPDAGTGFYGLTDFDFRLYPTTTCDVAEGDASCDPEFRCEEGTCVHDNGPPGYYVRQFDVGVTQESFNPVSGAGTFLVSGYASTSSRAFAFRPLNNQFRGSFSWIQVGQVSPRHDVETQFVAGASRVWLPDRAPEDEEAQ